jgi:hypothetical protein
MPAPIENDTTLVPDAVYLAILEASAPLRKRFEEDSATLDSRVEAAIAHIPALEASIRKQIEDNDPEMEPIPKFRREKEQLAYGLRGSLMELNFAGQVLRDAANRLRGFYGDAFAWYRIEDLLEEREAAMAPKIAEAIERNAPPEPGGALQGLTETAKLTAQRDGYTRLIKLIHLEFTTREALPVEFVDILKAEFGERWKDANAIRRTAIGREEEILTPKGNRTGKYRHVPGRIEELEKQLAEQIARIPQAPQIAEEKVA